MPSLGKAAELYRRTEAFAIWSVEEARALELCHQCAVMAGCAIGLVPCIIMELAGLSVLRCVMVLCVALSALTPDAASVALGGSSEPFVTGSISVFSDDTEQRAPCASSCTETPQCTGCVHCGAIPVDIMPTDEFPQSPLPPIGIRAFASPLLPGVYRPPQAGHLSG